LEISIRLAPYVHPAEEKGFPIARREGDRYAAGLYFLRDARLASDANRSKTGAGVFGKKYARVHFGVPVRAGTGS
jgi:hypothetical protein